MAKTITVACLVGILGALAGWSLRGNGVVGADDSVERRPVSPPASDPVEDMRNNGGRLVFDDTEQPSRRSADRIQQDTLARADEFRVPDQGLISTRLQAYVRSELRAGWGSARSDELPKPIEENGYGEFVAMVHEQPGQLGLRLAQDHDRLESALRIGPGFDLLELLDSASEADLGLIEESASFEALFQSTTQQQVTSGPDFQRDPDARLRDGLTLSYPTGVFRLDTRSIFRIDTPALRDVTIQGAGKDSTLLVLGRIAARVPLANMRFKDCTIFTGQDAGGLFDLRSAPASVVMERVRVIGFDSGGGGSNLFYAKQLLLYAVDSDFVSGYGRTPSSHTSLFDVRSDALIARFDRCLFQEISLSARDVRPKASVVFAGCNFKDMLDDAEQKGRSHPAITFKNCAFSRLPPDPETGRPKPVRRDLNEIFPDWERRLKAG